MARFRLDFHEENSTFALNFCEIGSTFALDFGEVVEIEKHYDPYQGPYTAIPETVMQTFPTKGKDMTQDFVVEEIPYAETTNIYGTTVTIAS